MRRAFTVVELLVVIAIIGVLVSVAIPAVQFAREAARKSQCSNNLRQIATAALAHNTAFDHFPNAGGVVEGAPRSVTSTGTPKRSIEQDWGVFYQILPYLEQKATYDGPANDVTALKLKIYFCPSRRPPVPGGVDYAGNGGSIVTSMNNQPGVIIPRPNAGGFKNPIITTAEIRDGQSNVLMFGERNYIRKPASTPPDEDNGFTNGWSPDTIRWSAQGLPRNSTWGLSFDTRFGGSHSGVVIVSMCDGSTRSLQISTVSDTLFRQITDRSDNITNGTASPQF